MNTFGLGPAQGFLSEVRLYAGKHPCSREGADREIQWEDDMTTAQRETNASLNPLERLHDHGQAVWLDYLSRRFIAEGGLSKLIQHDGLSGVTSNPSIFEKAIAGSADYDSSLKTVETQGDCDVMALYERLAIEDIQHAADALRPVYEATERRDGYVSLEVSPYLAMSTEATVVEARRLLLAVGRSNLMIKVPATKPGLAAIRQLIGEGINVNITLLFSQQVYEEVVEAYLAGIEHLLAQGGDASKIASVASFFVSRTTYRWTRSSKDVFARPTMPTNTMRSAGFVARSQSPMPSLPINTTSTFFRRSMGSCVPKARACNGFARALRKISTKPSK
jgi:transaldolase